MLVLLLLAACAPPRPFVAGAEQLGPLGWYDYCNRHPEDRSCAYATARETPDASGLDRASGP